MNFLKPDFCNTDETSLIIKGDNDGVDLEEVNEMYKALGGGVSGDMAGIQNHNWLLFLLPLMLR
jgi:hypothetical protein